MSLNLSFWRSIYGKFHFLTVGFVRQGNSLVTAAKQVMCWEDRERNKLNKHWWESLTSQVKHRLTSEQGDAQLESQAFGSPFVATFCKRQSWTRFFLGFQQVWLANESKVFLQPEGLKLGKTKSFLTNIDLVEFSNVTMNPSQCHKMKLRSISATAGVKLLPLVQMQWSNSVRSCQDWIVRQEKNCWPWQAWSRQLNTAANVSGGIAKDQCCWHAWTVDSHGIVI